MRNPYLYIALEAGPSTVKKLVEVLAAERYDGHRDPDRFTLRESVAHLADHEGVALQRFKVAVDTNGGAVLGYDPTQRGIEQGYAQGDPTAQARVFEERRAATVKYLRGLSGPDWDKIHIHSERGAATVYDQANLLASHDAYHIEHLTRFFRDA